MMQWWNEILGSQDYRAPEEGEDRVTGENKTDWGNYTECMGIVLWDLLSLWSSLRYHINTDQYAVCVLSVIWWGNCCHRVWTVFLHLLYTHVYTLCTCQYEMCSFQILIWKWAVSCYSCTVPLLMHGNIGKIMRLLIKIIPTCD